MVVNELVRACGSRTATLAYWPERPPTPVAEESI